MAVLVEAVSVIVRVTALDTRHEGGWEKFRTQAPNKTLCADKELARVGFLDPAEAKAYCAQLEERGLLGLNPAGQAQDYAVVDQMRGPLAPCPWLELGFVACQECPPVLAARLVGSTNDKVVTPPEWTYLGSLTQQLADATAQADAQLAAMQVPGSGRDN